MSFDSSYAQLNSGRTDVYLSRLECSRLPCPSTLLSDTVADNLHLMNFNKIDLLLWTIPIPVMSIEQNKTRTTTTKTTTTPTNVLCKPPPNTANQIELQYFVYFRNWSLQLHLNRIFAWLSMDSGRIGCLVYRNWCCVFSTSTLFQVSAFWVLCVKLKTILFYFNSEFLWLLVLPVVVGFWSFFKILQFEIHCSVVMSELFYNNIVILPLLLLFLFFIALGGSGAGCVGVYDRWPLIPSIHLREFLN